MYSRALTRPDHSFFLFGPRGTGKSTWLKEQSFDLRIDLLDSKSRIDLERKPHLLRNWTAHLKAKQQVVIDEVQKIPALLDEVHYLIEERKLQFALSGSSARKLKRSQANLLAGRAINCHFFPLNYSEYGKNFSLSDRLNWGTLPLVISEQKQRKEVLETYIENYLKQELVEEGIIRKLDPFLRFLQVAALMNGQVLNVENIARDCKVGRTTVDKYFEILIDTLLGFYLPAYEARARVKELSSSKFYFFDPGVTRAAAGLTRETLDRSYLGYQFETFLLNEIRSYNEYSGKKRPLFYYGISGRGDIDLIIRTRTKTHSQMDKIVAIEMKLGEDWKSDWGRLLEDLRGSLGQDRVTRLIGIYTGDRMIRSGNIEVFPVDLFLTELFAGNIY